MIALIWRFEVREENRTAFEAVYGPKGDWAQLFTRSGGFRGSELLRAQDGSYLTVDVWRAKADFDAFKAEHGADYEALDRRTEGWTRAEHPLGEYLVVD
ncbi:antibiotic biosynthesis monooxygenase family protein [Sphingosinicella terrae]|uniref:antibiotic biosynthesis monooxygenase family protein n=1 Tax=Sphingosinicella terrae TaxID=2172047 RepID=UPI000E0DED7D|nr:antibiotic biosynthesis monooxygenase [Sphingosinicella terrae]